MWRRMALGRCKWRASWAMASSRCSTSQTPPDLVVNFNLLILLALFYDGPCDRALCINGKSRAKLPSTYDDSCPPLNPMECGNLLFELCSEALRTGKRGRPRKTLPKGVKVR